MKSSTLMSCHGCMLLKKHVSVGAIKLFYFVLEIICSMHATRAHMYSSLIFYSAKDY